MKLWLKNFIYLTFLKSLNIIIMQGLGATFAHCRAF